MCKNSRWYSWLGDFVSSAFSANSAVKRELKKQSQFVNGQNDVKSILTMSYGDFDGPGRRENKANSKPIAGLWLEIRNGLNGSRIMELRLIDL